MLAVVEYMHQRILDNVYVFMLFDSYIITVFDTDILVVRYHTVKEFFKMYSDRELEGYSGLLVDVEDVLVGFYDCMSGLPVSCNGWRWKWRGTVLYYNVHSISFCLRENRLQYILDNRCTDIAKCRVIGSCGCNVEIGFVEVLESVFAVHIYFNSSSEYIAKSPVVVLLDYMLNAVGVCVPKVRGISLIPLVCGDYAMQAVAKLAMLCGRGWWDNLGRLN